MLCNKISAVKYLSFQWPSNFPPLVAFTQSKGNSSTVRTPEKPDTKSRFDLHFICPKIFSTSNKDQVKVVSKKKTQKGRAVKNELDRENIEKGGKKNNHREIHMSL